MINFNKQKRNKIASILIVLCRSYLSAADKSPWGMIHEGESITRGGWTEVLPSTNSQWNQINRCMPDSPDLILKQNDTTKQYTLVQDLRGRPATNYNTISLYTKSDQKELSREVLLLGKHCSIYYQDPLPDNNQHLADLTLTEYHLSVTINNYRREEKGYEVHIKTNVALNGYALLYVLRALGKKSGIWEISNEWGIKMNGQDLVSTDSQLVCTRSIESKMGDFTLDTAEKQEVPQLVQFPEASDGFVCVNSAYQPSLSQSSQGSDGITFVTPNVDKYLKLKMGP